MNGIIGRALAGAAGGVKDASLEMMRAEILAQRDARLHAYDQESRASDQAYRTSERVAGQEYQSGESAANREFTSNENAQNRDVTREGQQTTKEHYERSDTETARHNKAKEKTGSGDVSTNAKEQRELEAQGYPRPLARAIAYDQIEKVQSPLGLETIWRDKSSNAVVAKIDENGAVVKGPGWKALMGKDDEDPAAAEKKTDSGKDYSYLWSGAPAEKQPTDTSSGDAQASERAPESRKSQRQIDEERLAYLESALGARPVDLFEGGFPAQVAQGRRHLGTIERIGYERERDTLKKKLGVQ